MKAGLSVNQLYSSKLMWVILRVTVVHSCSTLYYSLLLWFIESMQPSEDSRTDICDNCAAFNLRSAAPQRSAIDSYSLCLSWLNNMQMTPGWHKVTIHILAQITLLWYKSVFQQFWSWELINAVHRCLLFHCLWQKEVCHFFLNSCIRMHVAYMMQIYHLNHGIARDNWQH